MIICICHRVSDRHIEAEVSAGCSSFAELQDFTGEATGCGVCQGCARETFDAKRQAHGCPGRASARPGAPFQSALQGA